jgi:hypothetical protein
MRRVILPASVTSELEWPQVQPEDGPILWEFDFGWNKSEAPLFLSDKGAFNAHVLAVEEYSKKLSQQVVLYRGSLGIVSRIVGADDAVEAATIFGDYLHRLASFLPDSVTPYCLFESSPFPQGLSAQLMSKERFLHLELFLGPNLSPTAILLPPDELCTAEVLHKLEKLIALVGECRIIPQLRLSEMWEGLDILYVIPEAINNQGHRHLKGFEAAGGKIKSFN